MASSQNKVHAFDFEALLNIDINQQNWKSIKKKFENSWKQLKLEIEEGMIEAEAEKYVEIFNKIFTKAELPEIGLDDLRNNLDDVAAGIEKALSLINNVDTSALKGIETELEGISNKLETIGNKIGNNVRKSTNSAIASVSKLDEVLSKIGDSTKDIEDVLKFEGTGDAKKQSRELNKLSEEWKKLEDARIESVNANTKEDAQNWVKRQQAMVKFVRAYESYAKIAKKPKEEYTQLYNKLLPKSHDAELNLTNLLDRRAGSYSPKTEPWARENTLKEVRDILKTGIKVSGDEKKDESSKASSSTSESSGTKDVSIKNSDTSDSDKLGRQTVEQNQRIIQQKIRENERKISELEKDIAARKTYKMYKGIDDSEAKDIQERGDVYSAYAADYYSSSSKVAASYATEENASVVVAEIAPKVSLTFDAQKYVDSGDYEQVLSSPEFLSDLKAKLKEQYQRTITSAKKLQSKLHTVDQLKIPDKKETEKRQIQINEFANDAGFDSVIFDNVLDFASNETAVLGDKERSSTKKLTSKTIAVLNDSILKIIGFQKVQQNKNGNNILSELTKEIPEYYHMPEQETEDGDLEAQAIAEFSAELQKKIELENEIANLKKENAVLQRKMSSVSEQITDRIEVNANNTGDEQGADDTTSLVSDNTKAIQSYEQLNTVLQEYLELKKQKTQFEYTDEDNKWNSIEDIYRAPNSADEIKGDFDTQWKRILNIKNSIKKGYDSYLDPETKSSKALQDNTLEEENQKLESIALAYVNNTDANLELLNKTQRKFVDGIISEYNTWETDLKKRKEPYDKHNDPIEGRSLEIESQITNSASVGKCGDILHILDNVKMLGKIDAAAIEQLVECLGIKVPEAVKVAKTSIDDLNDSLEQTDQLEQKLSANGADVGVGTDDASSAAQAKVAELQEQKNRELAAKDAEIEQLQQSNDAKLEAIRDENTALKNDVETVKQQLESAKKEIVASQAREAEISKQLAEEEALIQELRKQLANVETGSGEKAEAIGIDDLKKALGDVTYKVKISHDDTDKQSNKIAIDEQTLKNVLNNITFNVNLIQNNNQENKIIPDVNSKDEDNQSGAQQEVRSQWQNDVRALLERIKMHTHNIVRQLRNGTATEKNILNPKNDSWALEKTLQTVKSVLDTIQTNTAKPEAVEIAPAKTDIGNVLATENTLAAIKTAVEAINKKVIHGTKVSTSGGEQEPKQEPDKLTAYVANDDRDSTSNKGNDKSMKLLADISLQRKNLEKFVVQLQTAGKLTDEYQVWIDNLTTFLDGITSTDDMTIWKKAFARTKTSVGIDDVVGRAEDKETGAAYKELIELQKTRNELELKHAKAQEGSAAKQFYAEQLAQMDQVIARQRVIIDNDEYELKLAKMQEAQARKLGEAEAKEADKDSKKQATDAKKMAQKEAMFGKTRSAIGSAETVWINTGNLPLKTSDNTNQLTDEYYKKIVSLRKEQEKLRQSDSIKPKDRGAIIEHTQNLNKMTVSVKALIDEYQRLSGDNVNEDDTRKSTITNESNLDDYKAQLTKYVKEITYGKGQIKAFNAETKTLTYIVKTGKHEFTEYTAAVRHADDSLVSVRGATKKTETFFEATARKMKELTSYFSGMAVFNSVKQELQRGIQYVKEIDDAMTELRKVTDRTEASYDRFLDTAAKTANKVGSAIKEIVSSTADWARLNI